MSARYFEKNKEHCPPELWSTETARQARLVLLRARRRRLPRRMSASDPTMFCCAELIDTGHLDGWIMLGTNGHLHEISDVRITTLGREYLESFEEEMAESSLFRQRIIWLAKGFAVAVFFAGLLALVPETDMRADKPNDLETNSVPIPEVHISPILTQAALASVHPEKTLEADPTIEESTESIPTFSVQINSIE